MRTDILSQIMKFNAIFKRYEGIYRAAARKFDIPELTLWILYVLREDTRCTQKDLTKQLLQPKQSVHSALKTLEKDGYVELKYPENNRKSKYIYLTEKGASLAEDTVDKIIDAEISEFASLPYGERQTLLRLFDRLVNSLDGEIRKL